MVCMRFLSWKRVPWRMIVIQVLVLGGLVAFLKIYLPHRTRDMAQRAIAEREQKINALFHDSVEDSTNEISVPLNSAIVKRHPQRLRRSFSPEDAESMLGAPDSSSVDFRGGQHLTWIGTAHKLEAAFNSGNLYCLALEDRSTGNGVLVYTSFEQWHPY